MSFQLQCRNWIDGEWIASSSGRVFEVRNPADLRQVCHSYPLSTREDAEAAIRGAAKAFPAWRATPLGDKIAILRKAASLIRAWRDDIARIITLENGKLLGESLAEIDAAALELEFQIGEGERQLGRVSDGYRGGLIGFSRKEPLGVVSAIIPWNFPFNVPFRKLGPALLAGNTAILKPASQTPGVGEAVAHILIEAGVPAGVLQFITGSGGELSDMLVGHPLIRAVTFTGSTEVGRAIAVKAGANFTRAQLEMGGKNPAVVLDDADLDLAAHEVMTGAFSCAGQWCTATSRLIVDRWVADELVDRILDGVNALRLGPGTQAGATMGPVAGGQQLTSVMAHLDRAKEQKAQFVAGGDRRLDGDLAHGCFIAPTVIDNVTPKLDLFRTEVFGPVLAVTRVDGYEQALAAANDVPYGLSSSIFTRDLDRALHFIEHSEVGLTHVNIHSAYKEPQLSFGGVKESGFGLPEAGAAGIQFFQEEKAVYVRKN